MADDLPVVPRPVNPWAPRPQSAHDRAIAVNFPEYRGAAEPQMTFQDARAVPPTKRLNARIPIETLERVVEGALSGGVDPRLQTAIALQEGGPWPNNLEEAWRTSQDIIEHAARVPTGSRQEQIQAYNGMGRPWAFARHGAYSNQRRHELPENFYGQRIEDLERDVIDRTPEVADAVARVTARPHRGLSMEMLQLIGEGNDAVLGLSVPNVAATRVRYPNLLK